MKQKKNNTTEKVKLKDFMVCIFQQLFLRTVGSCGALTVRVKKKGNAKQEKKCVKA